MTIWAPGKSNFWLSDKFLKNWNPKVEVQDDESENKNSNKTQKQANKQKL